MSAERRDPLERFWEKVQKSSDPDGCWLWVAGKNAKGYGTFRADERRSVLAHRFSYEIHCGPAPDGRELDHLCRVRACVRPDHLEPVTHAENVRRGDAHKNAARVHGTKTHCPRGHAYTAGNTAYSRNRAGSLSRTCRACSTLNARARRGGGAYQVAKSGYRGVHWNAGNRKWTAVIGHNGRQHYLGLFTAPEAAARARDAKAIELHGEFASLNFPEEHAA